MTKDNLLASVQSSLLQGWLVENVLLHVTKLLASFKSYPKLQEPVLCSSLKSVTIWVNACFMCRAVSPEKSFVRACGFLGEDPHRGFLSGWEEPLLGLMRRAFSKRPFHLL